MIEDNSQEMNFQNKKRNRNLDNSDDDSNDEGREIIEKNVNSSNDNLENHNKKLRIVEPFKSLGLVIDSNQVCYFKRNNERLMVASNLHSFLVYNLDKLRLERISPPLPYKISCTTAYKNKVFTGVENKILLWEKIHIFKTYFDSSETCDKFIFKKLITFDKLLLAQKSNGEVLIFNIHSTKLIKKLNLNSQILIHPSTYLNKILFTKIKQQFEKDLNLVNSTIYLYNINTEIQIFEFDLAIKSDVIVIEQSLLIDVIGIAFASGDIVIFNIKLLKKLLSFKSENSVTALTFSSSSSLNISLLASANSNGIINIWDLNKNTLHYTISNKISNLTSISSLMFLPNEPLMIVTSGDDNSIKMYRFENNTGTPILLKQRCGHSTHPHKIRFYGENANKESLHLLSLSEKEFRNVSLLNEHMSKEFSFKNIPGKIKHEISIGSNTHNNTLLDFDFNEFRQRDWSNILLNLRTTVNPLLLSYELSAVTDILANVKSKSICTSICVSMCGNFGFAAFEDGSIEKFNMQSGLNRWTISKAHDKPIVGLKSDGINSMLISISLDGHLKFWDFLQSSLIKEINLQTTPELLEINRDNDLVGVTTINGGVFIYDKSTFKLVRDFSKVNSGRINDLTFSKDGKWLLSVSEDKSLRIFDIISGNLIEWIKFKNIPASVCISPNNQYIAITYVGLKGIYLWINRTLFVDMIDIEDVKEPIEFSLPFNTNIKSLKSRKDFLEVEASETTVLSDNESKKIVKLVKIPEDNVNLLQLSKESKIKFRILNHLEKVQEKNEPKIKKKEKIKAPFFLFDINSVLNTGKSFKDEDTTSPNVLNLLKNYSHFKNEKMLKHHDKDNTNEFILLQLLRYHNQNKIKSREITVFLNSLDPYLVDLEIRNLDPLLNEEGNAAIEYFLDYIHYEIMNKTNFELVQAYLNRFLKIFTEICLREKILKEKLIKINKEINESYKDLDYLYANTLCLISHFGKIQI